MGEPKMQRDRREAIAELSELNKKMVKLLDFLAAEIEIGNRICERRGELNLTQSQLGKLIGASRATVCAIERGHTVPSLKVAIKICYALNCTLNDLFYICENS